MFWVWKDGIRKAGTNERQKSSWILSIKQGWRGTSWNEEWDCAWGGSKEKQIGLAGYSTDEASSVHLGGDLLSHPRPGPRLHKRR